MHLVKWIRKNMRKIMTFVIIFIMLAFVVGQFGLKMIIGLMGGGPQIIATYDDGKKLKGPDFMQAENELTVLRMLMTDRLLLAQGSSGFSGPLLVYHLFPDSPFAGEIASQMKQAVQQGQLPITMDELNEFFQQRPERPEILWTLLKAEAYRAGCVLPNETATQTLSRAIPQMTNNQLDAAGLVTQIIQKNNISQDQILRIYADMLSVLSYASNVMDNQTVTTNQVKALIGRSKERIDADYVQISAEPFVDEDAEVTDAQIQQQFDKYKAEIPGSISDDNPFGFGYKLPKRIQLEYMLVMMDDVTKQIEKPTAEMLEQYYSNNLSKFQASEPSDPNNPDSEKVSRTRTFAESEGQIRRALEDEKTITLANIVFNEIKDKTEAGFETISFDQASVGQLQKAAGDFQAVATTLAEKHQIPIVTGKTGWLSADMLAQDGVLMNLGIRRGQSYLKLADLAFIVTEESSQQRKIGMPSIRSWQNIGPLSGFYSSDDGTFSRTMALVRVVGIQDAAEADSVDVEFKTQGVILIPNQSQEETVFTVKENVKNDVLLVNAMETAKNRAQELADWVAEKNWDDAIAAYNDKYAAADPNEIDDQRIELAQVKQQLRVSPSEITQAKRYMLQNPAAAQNIQQWLGNSLLNNTLYGLLEENAETTGTIHTVVPFDPQKACYVVKEIKRQPATTKDYIDGKTQTALQLNSMQSAPLPLKHFSTENILKRMNFESKLKSLPEDEPETPSQEDKTQEENKEE